MQHFSSLVFFKEIYLLALRSKACLRLGTWTQHGESGRGERSWGCSRLWVKSIPGVVSKLSDIELRITSSGCLCGLVELCWVAGRCQAHVLLLDLTNPLVFFCNVCVHMGVLQPPAWEEIIFALTTLFPFSLV